MKPLRILVAEDEFLIRIMLVEMLESLGHEVCASTSSQDETVQAALLTTPDLMIVDVRLGAGSGIAAVERILQSGFIPHVFATGDIPTDGGLHERAVAMRKPYDEADLVRAIALAAGRGDSAPTARWTSRARSSSE